MRTVMKLDMLLSLVLIACSNSALLAQQKDSGFFNQQSSILQWLADNKVPALGIGIIREGKLQQIRMYGELQKGVPAPYNAIFNVASLTKPVVSMLTLKLIDKGEWKLDEPLAQYWIDPDVMNDPRSKKLTTRHILSHQTGFVNWRWLHPSKKLAFDFEPGSRFQYSGEGFEYLRKALEKKFGKSLENLADSLILRQLKMHDTHFSWTQAVDEKRFAAWHDKEGKASYEITRQITGNAADDLLTTVEDYSNFGVWVLNGAGLSASLLKEMSKPQSSIRAEHDHMGLGWEVLDGFGNNEYAILHSGSDKGVQTLIIMLPVTKEGLVIFTNGDNGSKLYEKLITEFLTAGAAIMKLAH